MIKVGVAGGDSYIIIADTNNPFERTVYNTIPEEQKQWLVDLTAGKPDFDRIGMGDSASIHSLVLFLQEQECYLTLPDNYVDLLGEHGSKGEPEGVAFASND